MAILTWDPTASRVCPTPEEKELQDLHRDCDTFGGLTTALYGVDTRPPVPTLYKPLRKEELQLYGLAATHPRQLAGPIQLHNIANQTAGSLEALQHTIDRLNEIQETHVAIQEFEGTQLGITLIQRDEILDTNLYSFELIAGPLRLMINTRVTAAWDAIESRHPGVSYEYREQAKAYLITFTKDLREKERSWHIHKWLPWLWHWASERKHLDPESEEARLMLKKMIMLESNMKPDEVESLREKFKHMREEKIKHDKAIAKENSMVKELAKFWRLAE